MKTVFSREDNDFTLFSDLCEKEGKIRKKLENPNLAKKEKEELHHQLKGLERSILGAMAELNKKI